MAISKDGLKHIRINRYHAHELDKAISEHEANGYELVTRTSSESEHKQYNYRDDSRGNKYSYKDTEVHRKHTAVMRRVETLTLL